MNNHQAQLEAVLRGIEERTPHEVYKCWRGNGYCVTCHSVFPLTQPHEHVLTPQSERCTCDYGARVRAEQARAVERIGDVMYDHGGATALPSHVAWAAALRAVAPNSGDPT